MQCSGGSRSAFMSGFPARMTGSRCCFSYSQSSDLSIHEVHQVGRFPNPKLFIELGHNTCGVFETNDLGGSADCRLLRKLKMDEVKSLDPVELRKVDMNDFLDSMKRMKKSVSPDSLAPFETWNHKFGEGSG